MTRPTVLSHKLSVNLNSPYRSFITAKQLLYGAGNSPVTWNEARNLCYNYSEQTDRSDKGTWRLPNSCEAMAMLFKFTDNLWDKTVGRVMWSCDKTTIRTGGRLELCMTSQ